MQEDWAHELATERTLLAAERTFSAWIRTGLAALGGGLAVARALVFQNYLHQELARVIGWMLVIWGAGIFVFAIIRYRQTSARLSQQGHPNKSLGAMILMTAILLIIAALIFLITLQ
jgi:putative membrane protein